MSASQIHFADRKVHETSQFFNRIKTYKCSFVKIGLKIEMEIELVLQDRFFKDTLYILWFYDLNGSTFHASFCFCILFSFKSSCWDVFRWSKWRFYICNLIDRLQTLPVSDCFLQGVIWTSLALGFPAVLPPAS